MNKFEQLAAKAVMYGYAIVAILLLAIVLVIMAPFEGASQLINKYLKK